MIADVHKQNSRPSLRMESRLRLQMTKDSDDKNFVASTERKFEKPTCADWFSL